MAAAEDLRFVRFADPHAFLEATKQYDDSFMNFCIGSLHDFIRSPRYAAANPPPTYLFAIYRGDDLLLTVTGFLRLAVTHNGGTDFAWMMSTPTTAEALLTGTPTTPGLLAPAIALLAPSVLTELSPDPLVLDKLIGPDLPVHAFLAAWSALLAPRGIRIRLNSANNFGSRVSYVTRASLPPPPPTPSPHPVVQATADDLAALAQLYIAFQLDTPWHGVVTRDAALAFMAPHVNAGLVWFARVDGEPAGYVLLGRVTPRTISIRNVFVYTAHRRKGIAEAMVRGVSRYYLDAPPHGVQPTHEGPPAVGYKEEMNLNVADPGAERVYKRSGFLFPDKYGDVVAGGLDPATGRKAWYASAWLGVERDTDPSPEKQEQ